MLYKKLISSFLRLITLMSSHLLYNWKISIKVTKTNYNVRDGKHSVSHQNNTVCMYYSPGGRGYAYFFLCGKVKFSKDQKLLQPSVGGGDNTKLDPKTSRTTTKVPPWRRRCNSCAFVLCLAMFCLFRFFTRCITLVYIE